MIKEYWFKDGQWLEPFCPTGKCQVASRQCHECPMCLGINSVGREVTCGENAVKGYNEVPFEKLQVGDKFRVHPSIMEPIYTVLSKEGGGDPLVHSHIVRLSRMKYNGNVFVLIGM